MSKKVSVIFLAAATVIMGLTGCGSDSAGPGKENIEITTEEMEDALGTEAKHKIGDTYEVYGGVVTLCDYEGIDLIQYTYKMTDEYMKEQAEVYMKNNAYYEEVTDDIAEGDVLKCKIKVTIDEKTIDDYTDDNMSVSVGNSKFGKEFDDALTGKSVGDSGTETITYDDDFEETVFAGKKVKIEYTINSAERYVEPELSKENVKEIYQLESIDAYYDYIKQVMEKGYEDKTQSQYGTQIFSYLLDNCKFKSYDEDLLERYVSESLESYESYKDIMGVDSTEEVLEMMNITENDIRDTNRNYIYEEMVTYAIAGKEGITVTDEEVDEKIKEFTESCGYGSEEKFLEDYTRHLIRYWAYYEKVIALIVEKSNLEEVVQYDVDPFE